MVARRLKHPIKVFNADGTINGKSVTHYIDLTLLLDGAPHTTTFLITNIGNNDIILGYKWLQQVNPIIDWQKGTIQFPEINRVSTAMKLAQDQAREEAKLPPKTTEEIVPEEFHEYLDRFDGKAAERLPKHQPWDHKIVLKEGWEPTPKRPYKMSPREMEALEKFLEEEQRKGYIRPSDSPIVSPFFYVGKKQVDVEGKEDLRGCQDYRELNDNTVKDRYPIPRIEVLIEDTRGNSRFTKLDLKAGYNNIRIREGDEYKAAFTTPLGAFEPLVMYYGMCNSPSTLMRMMNTNFEDIIRKKKAIIYMDDVLIMGKDAEQLRQNTREVLERARQIDVYFKPAKCQFDQAEVEFCGFLISENKVRMDPVKLRGVKEWTTPRTVKDVRSFLGFAGFYRRFVPRFSTLARPLHDLTKKDKGWEWSSACEYAFQEIKARMLKEPVLMIPDPTKPFKLACDASKWASGGVLLQADGNGNWHPTGYISETFNETERRYQIYDRELLAIIRALTAWRHLLEGAPHPVDIHTDHLNLTYFRKPQRLNPRQARWLLFLSRFNCRLIHTPGDRMAVPDALSRRPDHVTDEEEPETVVLPESMWVKTIGTETEGQIPDALFIQPMSDHRITQLSHPAKDSYVREAIAALKGEAPNQIKASLQDWSIDGKLVSYKGRYYVPINQELRKEIVKEHHDSPIFGHPGWRKTLELTQRTYWWPGMTQFIKKYVEGCAICQQTKPITNPTSPPTIPNPVQSTRPFAGLSMDLIVKLPESNGYDSILVVVDQGLTKGVKLIPCNETIDSMGVANALRQQVFRHYGFPDYIISDRGPQFASKVMESLAKSLGYERKLSTAYHPQTDGETERVNQELENYLRAFCASEPHTWSEVLDLAEFAHNVKEHSATGTSPFKLIFGTDVRPLPDSFKPTNTPAADQKLAQIIKIRNEARAALEIARRKMVERKRVRWEPFKEGDMVWLDASNLNTGYPSKKLAPKREGPFRIKRVKGPVNYELEIPTRWKINPIFHAKDLVLFRENDIHGPNYIKPPPDLVQGQEEFEVEAIVGHKPRNNPTHFLIKWKGYPTADNTWQTRKDLNNAKEILNDYLRRLTKAQERQQPHRSARIRVISTSSCLLLPSLSPPLPTHSSPSKTAEFPPRTDTSSSTTTPNSLKLPLARTRSMWDTNTSPSSIIRSSPPPFTGFITPTTPQPLGIFLIQSATISSFSGSPKRTSAYSPLPTPSSPSSHNIELPRVQQTPSTSTKSETMCGECTKRTYSSSSIPLQSILSPPPSIPLIPILAPAPYVTLNFYSPPNIGEPPAVALVKQSSVIPARRCLTKMGTITPLYTVPVSAVQSALYTPLGTILVTAHNLLSTPTSIKTTRSRLGRDLEDRYSQHKN
jgi:hypothetical protein